MPRLPSGTSDALYGALAGLTMFSGHVNCASENLATLGLEWWLYRLLSQPSRIKRQPFAALFTLALPATYSFPLFASKHWSLNRLSFITQSIQILSLLPFL